MAPAVLVMDSSGRRSRRTMTQDSTPSPTSTSAETTSSIHSRCRSVESRSVSGTATTITPVPSTRGLARAR